MFEKVCVWWDGEEWTQGVTRIPTGPHTHSLKPGSWCHIPNRDHLVSPMHASPVQGSVYASHHEQSWKLKLEDLTNGELMSKLQM